MFSEDSPTVPLSQGSPSRGISPLPLEAEAACWASGLLSARSLQGTSWLLRVQGTGLLGTVFFTQLSKLVSGLTSLFS